MAAGYYKLIIEQGATFGKTLLFGSGAIFNITTFAEDGANVIVKAANHTFLNGDKVKIVAYNKDRNVNYIGSYTIADVIAGVSFTVVATWQGSIAGTVQAARDLTGYGLRAQIRADYDDVAALVEITAAISDLTGGVGALSRSAVDTTADAAIDTAVWTCELYHLTDSTVVERILTGPAVITPEAAK